MKNLTRWALMALASTALIFGACDSDDDGTEDDTMVADTTESDVEEDAAADTTTAGATDQCTNEADLAVVQSTDPAGTAGSCGRGCIAAGDFTACTADCMLNGTNDIPAAGLSAGCTQCYAASANCSKENCLGECINPDTADECATCQATAGCLDSFYDCSGLQP